MRVVFTKAKLEGWALVAQIGGALAVIVSVIYLGKQINDNTKLLRSQAHYNALSLAQKPLEMMVENDSLAGAVTECDAIRTASPPRLGSAAPITTSCSSIRGSTCTIRTETAQSRNNCGLEQMPTSRRLCKQSQATCAFGKK